VICQQFDRFRRFSNAEEGHESRTDSGMLLLYFGCFVRFFLLLGVCNNRKGSIASVSCPSVCNVECIVALYSVSQKILQP